jgi:hypothetical protein
MDRVRSRTGRRLAIVVLAGVLGIGGALSAVRAQTPPGVVRLALVPQWVIQQHRAGVVGGPLSSVLREALDGGVVDRTVYSWQRGVIQRQALVAKPIRVVPHDEAAALGGRGRFALGAVRPPTGRAAWTEVEITRAGSDAHDDVVVLEVGGERNTVTQVLETLLVAEPGRGLTEVALARTALVAGSGVPVVTAYFERPLPAAMAQRFREEAGMGILVARSPLWDVRNGDRTSSGPADTVPYSGGDWREGDRVFLRIPVAALDRGVPGLVLGWKDRTLQTDPNGEFPRRSSLSPPLIR